MDMNYGGEGWREGVCRMEWSEGGKWDNCISIINKIYLKNKIKLEKKIKLKCLAFTYQYF